MTAFQIILPTILIILKMFGAMIEIGEYFCFKQNFFKRIINKIVFLKGNHSM